MQKNGVYIGMCAFALLFVAVSCKKDSGSNNQPKTKTDLLVQNTWKFDNAKVAGADVSGFIDACDKDNTLSFTASGGGTADEGPSKCDAADPQTVAFTWVFQNSDTEIKANVPLFPLGNDTFTIVSLTETQLIVSQDVDIMGSTQNAVITFKK